jgi:hypothetical protein
MRSRARLVVWAVVLAGSAWAESVAERDRREEAARELRAAEQRRQEQRAKDLRREEAQREQRFKQDQKDRREMNQKDLDFRLRNSRNVVEEVDRRLGTPVPRRAAPAEAQVLWGEGLPPRMWGLLRERVAAGATITSVAFPPQPGGFLVTWDRNGFFGEHLPPELRTALYQAQQRGEQIRFVAFTPSSGWAFVRDEGGFSFDGLTPEAGDALRASQSRQTAIHLGPLAFWRDGFLVACNNSAFKKKNPPRGLLAGFETLYGSYRMVRVVATRPDNEYVVAADGSLFYFSDGLPPKLNKLFAQLAEEHRDITAAALAPEGGWVVLSQ